MKVGGSSVQTALMENCNKKDIVIMGKYPDKYEGPESTCSQEPIWEIKDFYEGKIPHIVHRFGSHSKPNHIQFAIGRKIWNTYCKVTIVRNPWDIFISSFWWYLHIKNSRFIKENISKDKINKVFGEFLKGRTLTIQQRGGYNINLNKSYYFCKNKTPFADVYLRFENLQDDFDKFSDSLKIPKVNLPHFKSQFRKDKRHYSTYYNDELIEYVANHHKDIIDYFGYKFENKN